MLITLAGRTTIQAQDQRTLPKEDGKELGRYLFDALISASHDLQSGRYTAAETVFEQRPGKIVAVRQGTIECVFDSPHHLLRVEELGHDVNRSGEARLRHAFFVETPERCVRYSPLAKEMRISPSTHAKRLRPERYFDVRGVGIQLDSEWTYSLDEFRELLVKQGCSFTGRRLAQDGQYELTVSGERLRRVYKIDGSRQYRPLSLQVQGMVDASSDEWRTTGSTVVDWGTKSGAVVPLGVRTTSPRGFRHVIGFEWHSVNTTPPRDLFRRESIHLAPGTTVADNQADPNRWVIIEVTPTTEAGAGEPHRTKPIH